MKIKTRVWLAMLKNKTTYPTVAAVIIGALGMFGVVDIDRDMLTSLLVALGGLAGLFLRHSNAKIEDKLDEAKKGPRAPR